MPIRRTTWIQPADAITPNWTAMSVLGHRIHCAASSHGVRYLQTFQWLSNRHRMLVRTAVLVSVVATLFYSAWPADSREGGLAILTASAQGGCSPRPRIHQQVSVTGDSRLRIDLTAGAGTLHELRFLTPINGLIDIGAQIAVPGDFTYAMPAGLSQASFFVRRVTPNQPTNVRYIAVDDCGDWWTFAGVGTAYVIVTAVPGVAGTPTPVPTNTPTVTPTPTGTGGVI